jgi:hypothetical protein
MSFVGVIIHEDKNTCHKKLGRQPDIPREKEESSYQRWVLGNEGFSCGSRFLGNPVYRRANPSPSVPATNAFMKKPSIALQLHTQK